MFTQNKTFNQIAGHKVQRLEAISNGAFAIGTLFCFINTYKRISIIILIQLNYALAIFLNQ